MSNIKIFENKEFGQVRTIEENGTIYFCGSDVATALGYAKPNNAINQHCKGATLKQGIIDNLGRTQEATFITEPDLYRLIISSKLPKAQQFEAWVMQEVLPSIRKYGAYQTPGYQTVVNLINMTRQSMKDQGCNPREIATAIKQICEQFNIKLPDCFVKPQKITLQDAMDMIDFIFAYPKGKKPTYEEFIIYKSLKRIGS